METFDPSPAINVQEAEYHRLLGWPRDHAPGERARELATWARSWYAEHGRPWVYFRRVDLQFADNALKLDGFDFNPARLRQHLRDNEATSAVLVAVSAGRECEEHARQLWNEGRPDEYFFLEIFGSAVVEDLVARLSGRLCDLAADQGLMAVPHYSPGYTGWDVADQHKLFSLITQKMSGPFPGPIDVMSSGMLRPKKSLLAVFGLAPVTAKNNANARGSTPCESCSFGPCSYRRAPYRHADRASAPTGKPEASSTLAQPLTRNANYSVNARALRKWATERVQVDSREDGTVDATFRFDGTTCSNQGHPLAFDYRVSLSSPDEGYRILRSSCSPASGDDGYEYTCAYLQDADGFMQNVAREKPLLGQPIDEVLGWSRPAAPSGCHCTADSRAHKWGLALEAIHFALVQAQARNLPAVN
ncbi:MAG TPA: hypothetical protein VGM64_06370 [Lacunisphaera sp.]|jgi:hypothetical protein